MSGKTRKALAKQKGALTTMMGEAVDWAQKNATIDGAKMKKLLTNKSGMQEGILCMLTNLSSGDSRFEMRQYFELTVPKTYVHAKQLGKYIGRAQKQKKLAEFTDRIISDEHYANVTHQLEPGRTYGVKVFFIKNEVTPEECLEFLASQEAILTGVQGLSLVLQLHLDVLLREKHIISFDRKEALWKGDDYWLPYAYVRQNGIILFDSHLFHSRCLDYYCLLCFCEVGS